MKRIETSGKTVEAAVKNGLKELGCEAADVDIEILEMGSPGLFGMFGKLAKVRLTVKEKEDDFKIDMPVFTLDIGKEKKAPKKEAPKQEKPMAEPKAEKPAQPKAEPVKNEEPAAQPKEEPKAGQADCDQVQEEKQSSGRARRERGGRRHSERRKAEKSEKPAQTEQNAPAVEVAPFVAADPETWSEEARMAVDFLKNTTAMMGVEVTIEVSEGEEAMHVRMTGDTLGVLIGRRGETLDALQYLTSLHVNKGRDGYIRVSLDSENYRAKREEALRKLALRMAQRARKTGHRVVLEPMNPYERRILHSALQGNPYVQTHSEGEDPYRRVIITLK